MLGCQEFPLPENVDELELESQSLVNLIGDSSTRNVLVYLPPSYVDSVSARYPSIYLLHAFGVTNRDWLGTENGYDGLNLSSTLDSLVASGQVGEMIVVMPDAMTKLGGPWYSNSPASGNWEDFIADDLVSYVDEHYRTISDPTYRGIAGQSMGGYGAVRIAMLRPDVFSAALGMSPVPTENPNPLGEAGMRAALSADTSHLAQANILARILWSRAAAFSPDSGAPPTYSILPYSQEDNELIRNERIWSLWSVNTLFGLTLSYADGLKQLRLRLEVGRDDSILDEVQRLSYTFREVGIAHDFEVFDGDHVSGVRERFESSVFQYFTHVFAQ